jgi:hypothetical protein
MAAVCQRILDGCQSGGCPLSISFQFGGAREQELAGRHVRHRLPRRRLDGSGSLGSSMSRVIA